MSQLVAFTFGSFGDIFTILGLAWSVRQLLSDSRGASAECRLLVEYLVAFSTTMEIVKGLAFDNSSITPAAGCGIALLMRPEYKPAANAVLHALSVCRRLLEDFKIRLHPYEEHLLMTRKNTIRDIWWAFTWLPFRQEALELRTNLEAQASCIHRIICALSLPETVKLQMKLDSQEQSIRLLTSQSVADMSSSRRVGRGLPAGVHLTDILNDSIFVPSEWCRTLADFDEYLRYRFEKFDRKGKTFVVRGRYQLESGTSNELISPATWAEHAQAGKAILMNVVLERLHDEDPHTCPSCGTENRVGAIEAGCEIQCSSCSTIFKAITISAPSILTHNRSGTSVDGVPSPTNEPPAYIEPYDPTNEDLSFIRRISVIARSRNKASCFRCKAVKVKCQWLTSWKSCIRCHTIRLKCYAQPPLIDTSNIKPFLSLHGAALLLSPVIPQRPLFNSEPSPLSVSPVVQFPPSPQISSSSSPPWPPYTSPYTTAYTPFPPRSTPPPCTIPPFPSPSMPSSTSSPTVSLVPLHRHT